MVRACVSDARRDSGGGLETQLHPWVRKTQEEGMATHPLQCSCLGNPVDRGAWRATVHGLTESQT